jgi:hypothetical protein
VQSALGASLQEGLLHTPQAGPTPAGVIPVQLLPNVWNAHAVPQQQYIYTAPSYSTMQMAPANYYSTASVNGEASETGSSAAPSGFVMVPNEQSYINYQVGVNAANSSFNSYNNWANYANWAAAGSQAGYVPEYAQWQQQQQGAGASPGQISTSSHMQHHLSYSPHTPSHMQQHGTRGGVGSGLSGLSVRGYLPVTPHYSAARLTDPSAAGRASSSAAAGTYVTNLDPRTMR